MKKSLLAILILAFALSFSSCGGDDEPDIPEEDDKEIVENNEDKCFWLIEVIRNWNYSCEYWDNMFPEKWEWIEANKDNQTDYNEFGIKEYSVKWEFYMEDTTLSEVEELSTSIKNWSIGWTRPNGFWQYDVMYVNARNLTKDEFYSFKKEIGENEFPFVE